EGGRGPAEEGPPAGGPAPGTSGVRFGERRGRARGSASSVDLGDRTRIRGRPTCSVGGAESDMKKARPDRGGLVPPALRLRNQLVVAADRVMRRADELVIGDGSLIVAPHSGTRQDRATYLDAQCVGLALISGPALEVVPTVSRLTRVLLPDQIHDVRDRGGVQQLRDLLREGDRHPGDGQLVRPSLASADGLAPDYPAVQCIRINSKRSTDAGQHGQGADLGDLYALSL